MAKSTRTKASAKTRKAAARPAPRGRRKTTAGKPAKGTRPARPKRTTPRDDALLAAILRLEKHLSEAGRKSPAQCAKMLMADMKSIRKDVAAHVRETEGGGGLHDAVRDDLPHLRSRLKHMYREHRMLERQIDGLEADIKECRVARVPQYDKVRGRAEGLLTALRDHFDSYTTLAFDVFHTDLGVKD